MGALQDILVVEQTEGDDEFFRSEQKTLALKSGQYVPPKKAGATLEELQRRGDTLAATVQDKRAGNGSDVINCLAKAAAPVKFLSAGVKMVPVLGQVAGSLSGVGCSYGIAYTE